MPPQWVMYTAFSLDSIIDIAITGAIAVFLWRKRTGFASYVFRPL
jgi:hypothetical protein